MQHGEKTGWPGLERFAKPRSGTSPEAFCQHVSMAIPVS